MTETQPGSRTARILYRPWGMVAGIVAGLVASQVFRRVWRRVDPASPEEPPQPLESEYGVGKILVAAVIQGAIFFAVRALVDRGGARLFERWTGEWPGD